MPDLYQYPSTYPTYIPQPRNSYPNFYPQLSLQQQPSFQKSLNVNGRIVKSENEIMPNEIPMDGSISLFPLTDYSKIVAKQWNSDGTISTVEFSPVKTEETTSEPKFEESVMKRFDNLEAILTSRSNKRYTSENAKKKEAENGQ